MNPTNIFEALDAIAKAPFDHAEFGFSFAEATDNAQATVSKLRGGSLNRSARRGSDESGLSPSSLRWFGSSPSDWARQRAGCLKITCYPSPTAVSPSNLRNGVVVVCAQPAATRSLWKSLSSIS